MDPIRRIIKPKEAYARAGITRVTAWKMEKEGKFPAAIWITKGRKGYLESDLNAWIDGLVAKRDAAMGEGA
jgi:predicted DNA-binding transcriptional regulator AlpA